MLAAALSHIWSRARSTHCVNESSDPTREFDTLHLNGLAKPSAHPDSFQFQFNQAGWPASSLDQDERKRQRKRCPKEVQGREGQRSTMLT